MTTSHRRHFVTFYSPGTFVAEQSTKPISGWNIAEAVALMHNIVERHNAKPYGFRFETRLTHNPIEDGEGGELQVRDKTVKESGMHHIDGIVETIEDVEKRADPKERTLLSNLKYNDWPACVVTYNSFKATQPLMKDDVVVDTESGEIVDRGKDYY